ncbi:YuzD family protein [Shouchella clausii]|uniref:YuzD family protein n=1 Tax=Shouchella clausii TaxID=79880 RepID=UPI0021479EC3|nr:YuzD family protein [Shouchella clausii]MCR1287193.1 YuzD family protein [Shouchella clausii]
MAKSIMFTIYGAKQKCASCVHLPSALDTKEWLEAALIRKFPQAPLEFHYVDIDEPQSSDEKQRLAAAILNEEYFYPLVVLNGEVVAEGNPNLKMIAEKVEALLA